LSVGNRAFTLARGSRRRACAFEPSPVEAKCAEFKERRDIMVAGLNKIKGFSCRLPKGAFYDL
jgi:aspartate/methionine/tyrosine aminotransferase